MSRHEDFYIGWANRIPRTHRGVLALVTTSALAWLLLLAVGLARATDDPGAGTADWAAGEQTLRGTVTAAPTPLIQVPSGHVVILAMSGKYPVVLPPGIEGHAAEATGWLLHRGSLEVLQMTQAPHPINLPSQPTRTQQLGRWRLTGEICDGKCTAGAMRPGTGIAHRACADLCLIEGAPPVFVTTAPIAGTSFLLINAPDAALLKFVGLRVRLDGAVERRGDILVFTPDLTTALLP